MSLKTAVKVFVRSGGTTRHVDTRSSSTKPEDLMEDVQPRFDNPDREWRQRRSIALGLAVIGVEGMEVPRNRAADYIIADDEEPGNLPWSNAQLRARIAKLASFGMVYGLGYKSVNTGRIHPVVPPMWAAPPCHNKTTAVVNAANARPLLVTSEVDYEGFERSLLARLTGAVLTDPPWHAKDRHERQASEHRSTIRTLANGWFRPPAPTFRVSTPVALALIDVPDMAEVDRYGGPRRHLWREEPALPQRRSMGFHEMDADGMIAAFDPGKVHMWGMQDELRRIRAQMNVEFIPEIPEIRTEVEVTNRGWGDPKLLMGVATDSARKALMKAADAGRAGHGGAYANERDRALRDRKGRA